MKLSKNILASLKGYGWQHQRTDDELRNYIENLHQRVAAVDLEVSL
ncbi:MAG TPA: hypothetical protein VFQ70_02600 [Candidatus Saccharimonadaceae bacterium]|nr:hypothetical protein [Candidatus Saccharimonadaceae bacterium]